MLSAITGTLIVGVAIAMLGGIGPALLSVATMTWLLMALRPTEAGPLVAAWSRQRFE